MYGIKSHSILSLYIDIVRDIPIDYMHMILEGISKMELSIRKWVLWILFYNIKFKSI